MAAKDSVVIKSSAHGLTLVLNRDIAFEQLVREICNVTQFFWKCNIGIVFRRTNR